MDELIAEIRPFTQQSVLWVCAVIVTGMQLWNRVDSQPADVYRSLLSLYFDPELHIRFIVGYWSANPRRVLFHRRQVLLIAKIAIVHCSGGTDARLHAERFGSILLKANDQFDYGLLAGLANAGRPTQRMRGVLKDPCRDGRGWRGCISGNRAAHHAEPPHADSLHR